MAIPQYSAVEYFNQAVQCCQSSNLSPHLPSLQLHPFMPPNSAVEYFKQAVHQCCQSLNISPPLPLLPLHPFMPPYLTLSSISHNFDQLDEILSLITTDDVTVLPLLTAPPQDIDMYDVKKYPSSSSDTHPISTRCAPIYIAEVSLDDIQQTVEVETEETENAIQKKTTKKRIRTNSNEKGSSNINIKVKIPKVI